MSDVVKFQPNKTQHAESYYGGCPHCGKHDGHLNVEREHWFRCDHHKTKWRFGSNLFSDWREDGEEVWQQNRFKLAEYMTVDPMPPAPEEDELRSPEELGPNRGCDEHGNPHDPDHPWNRTE